MIGHFAQSPLDSVLFFVDSSFKKSKASWLFLLNGAVLSAVLIISCWETQRLCDIFSNISGVTGAATELGLLYRETTNKRVWASTVTVEEQGIQWWRYAGRGLSEYWSFLQKQIVGHVTLKFSKAILLKAKLKELEEKQRLVWPEK